MLFLYDNVAPIAVALVFSAVSWLLGGARGDLLVPVVPWLLVVLLEVIVCFPQRCRGETTYAARERTWHSMRRSPLVWTALGLLVLLLIPFVNNGLCLHCDAALVAQGADPRPRIPFLPFCVDRIDHLHVVLSFAVVLTCMVAVHHCMRRRGKRLTLELIVWNGLALALLGFVQEALGAPAPLWIGAPGAPAAVKGAFFSVFGYPNMAGTYFTLLFGVSVALWRDRCEKRHRDEEATADDSKGPQQVRRCERFLANHHFLILAAIFFYAAVNTLSRAAIVLVTTTAGIYFFHTLVIQLYRMKRSRRFVVGCWSVLAFLLVVFFASIFMPENLRKEVGTLDEIGVLDRVTGRGQYHVTVATSLWHDHPLFGCGGWGYKHFCVSKMRYLGIDVRKLQQTGGANVHNDYLQFLAEHGAVGLGALALMLVLLLLPVVRRWRELINETRFNRDRQRLPRPIVFFALPASAFILLVSVLATLVHAFGDCPLRSCAILSLVYVVVAATPGFLSHKQNQSH